MQPQKRKPRRGQRDLSLPVQEWRLEVGGPEHGRRLDGFLSERLGWRSRSSFQRVIRDGGVRVLPFKDPQLAVIGRRRPGLRLRAGQEVVVRLPALHAAAGAVREGELELEVVFEDSHLLAVSKPPGVSVYATRRHPVGSLIELVHARARRLGSGAEAPAWLCHRLDRETSGLVLFAKDPETRAGIGRQLEERTATKRYLGLVEGSLSRPSGRIDLPLGRDGASRVQLRMGAVEEGGRDAVTEWRVRRRLSGRTLLELTPRTGRQHQLRAHLAEIGHPLVGDKLYLGGDDVFLRSLDGRLTAADRSLLGMARQALHAWRIELEHPHSGRRLRLEAPLWGDLATVLAAGGEEVEGETG